MHYSTTFPFLCIYGHLLDCAWFIATLDKSIWFVLFFVSTLIVGLHMAFAGMCVLDSTIWTVSLNHHPLNRNDLKSLKVLICLQGTPIDP